MVLENKYNILNMKKYSIYIGLFILGLAIGRFGFGSASNDSHTSHSETEAATNTQWTCSMHPQILQPEAGDCPICGMELIPAESVADGLDINEFKLTKNAMALANIQTTVIGIQTGSIAGMVLSGKIVENENNNALQTTHFGGRIEKLYIETTGQKVRFGQKLALIYSPELVTSQKEFLTAVKSKSSDFLLYNAVKNKLKLWKLTATQINRIETSKKIITNFPIYASVSGIVSKKMIEEGQYVKKGQGLLTIANLNTVWADFDAYEKQLSSIKLGDKISIVTNANPNKKIEAKITFIDPILNTSTRTVVVRAVLNNSKGVLKPGMFVSGTFSKKTAKNSKKALLMIPKTAVMWTGKRSLVYIKKSTDEPIFEMREVVLGNAFSDLYEIIEGLEINDEIVTNGTFTVDAAAQLQSKRSMMNTRLDKKKKPEDKIIKRRVVPKKFQQQLALVYSHYLPIKDALVTDNTALASEKSILFKTALAKVNMKLLKDPKSHMIWMENMSILNNLAAQLATTTDINMQRNQLYTLSKALANAIQSFGINEPVYMQFCPMVNDDKGAYWLSKEEEIFNPYFGEMMLKCGNVKQTIN